MAAFVLALSVAPAPLEAQEKAKRPSRWEIQETDSETLWTGRYANCDYGFYVLLPDGFIAHSNLPPNPMHDFNIGLPDTGTTKFVSVKDRRFIWVVAEYDVWDLKSLERAVNYFVRLMGEDKPGFKLISRDPVKLNKVPATRIKAEYDGADGKIIEEEIVAVHWGIIYEVGLQTTAPDYASDKAKLDRIITGFRFWKIHYC